MRRGIGVLVFALGGMACGSNATEVTPGAGSASGSSGGETTTGSVSVTDSNSTTAGTDSMSATTADTMTASDSNTTTGTTTQGSVTDGTSSGTMGVTEGSTGDASGSTGIMVCEQDDTEDNDAQVGSQALTDAVCAAAGINFLGTLDGATDIDWYGLFADWNNSCNDEAQITVNVGQGLTVCAYHDCNSGNQLFQCSGGSSSATATNGDPGCCGTDTAALQWECNNNDNDAIISISVTGASGTQCLDYSADYQMVSGNFI